MNNIHYWPIFTWQLIFFLFYVMTILDDWVYVVCMTYFFEETDKMGSKRQDNPHLLMFIMEIHTMDLFRNKIDWNRYNVIYSHSWVIRNIMHALSIDLLCKYCACLGTESTLDQTSKVKVVWSCLICQVFFMFSYIFLYTFLFQKVSLVWVWW